MSYSLDDLRDRLALLDADVRAKEAAVNATPEAQAFAAALAIRNGAEQFIARLAAETPSEVPATAQAAVAPASDQAQQPRRPSVGNADVINAIIAEFPEGISLTELQRVASERGHDLDAEQIRSAVTYLRRRGDAENIRRGVWRTIPEASPGQPNGPAEARPFALTPPPLPAVAAAG